MACYTLAPILAIIIYRAELAHSAGFLEYADPCDSGKGTCNPESDIRCDGRSCTCNPGAFYDRDRKHCVIPIDSFCKNVYFHGGSSDRERACPKNASCESISDFHGTRVPESVLEGLIHSGMVPPEGYFKCTCDTGFAPDPNKRKCIPVLEHGAACSNTKEKCKELAGLTCGSSGSCVCKDEKTTEYDEESRRCGIRLGEKCSTKTWWHWHRNQNSHVPCVGNAICSSLLEALYRHREIMARRHWMFGMWKTQNEICVCAPGFTPTSQHKCAGSYHVDCSDDLPCNTERHLTCINGACQCAGGTTEVFEENRNASCHILPGSPCSTKSGPKCVENAICKSGRCECADGFSEHSDKCLLTYEKECNSGSVADSCNYYHGLACIESKCKCFDSSLKWNMKQKTCTAGEGDRCGKINFSESETDILHRDDPFYPLTALPTARTYFQVGCDQGLTCSELSKEAHGRKHCKKS